MTRHLFILNDAPYWNERSANALRMAGALSKRGDHEVRVFLFGDAAHCARRGQRVPEGFFDIEALIAEVVAARTPVGICSTCMDARGIKDYECLPGTERKTLADLAEWSSAADKIISF